MQKDTNLILVISDALAKEYPKDLNMRFLESCLESSKSNISSRIIPSTGYCEIVEYFTGLESSEHKLLGQLNIDKDWESIRKRKKIKLKILDLVERLINNNLISSIPKVRYIYNKIKTPVINSIVNSLVTNEVARVRYDLPLNILPYVYPTESRFKYDDNRFFGEKNIFSRLRKGGYTYDLSLFVEYNKIKGDDNYRINELTKKIKSRNLENFTVVYLGQGEMAHITGTKDHRFKSAMQTYDKKLKSISKEFFKEYPNGDLIILGDHGMINVKEAINPNYIKQLLLKRFGYKFGKDYLYFVDSTLLRIWLSDRIKLRRSDIEKTIGEWLEPNAENGKEEKTYLSSFSPEYGDILFMLRPGYMFCPDFFNAKINKGMHGYFTHHKGQQGIMIHLGKGATGEKKEAMKLSDIYDYCLNQFGIN